MCPICDDLRNLWMIFKAVSIACATQYHTQGSTDYSDSRRLSAWSTFSNLLVVDCRGGSHWMDSCRLSCAWAGTPLPPQSPCRNCLTQPRDRIGVCRWIA